jgi:XapX domain-containing protein
MNGYLVSLLMGLAVGVAYGLVQIRSPAPPLIALVDLLGMVLGEQTSTWREITSCGAPTADLPSRSYCKVARGCRGGMTYREIWLSMRAR